MMWKWLAFAASLCVASVPAWSACTVKGNPGGQLGTGSTLLGTESANQVNITGGCIDGTPIGQNTPAAGSFTTETVTGSQTATGALNNFGTSTSAPAHLTTAQTTAPALTSCGTGSPSIVGSDTAGTITMGTSAAGCTLTFNVAYTTRPFCSVDWETNLAAMAYVVAAATITITQTATSGNLIDYICIGTAGG